MDKITQYQSYIKQVLSHHADLHLKGFDEYETQLLLDDERKHYAIIRVGWEHMDRTHSCMVHMGIKDDKIWIQQDWTEEGTANELVALGVPKSDIILAFYPPYKRPYTDFGVA